MEDASFSPWSELPPDLVGSVVTHLPSAVDCARFRAVCRSWQSAMRNHGSPARQPLPWVVLPDGRFVSYFLCPSARSHRPASFPKNARCIGSSGSWLFLHCMDAAKKYTCLLYNPFTHTTVPIPELDSIIEDVTECSMVTKVLMRSGPDDVVALMTNDRWNYPIILARAGKGVWFPEAQNAFFARIIDIVFLGGKLYGITKAEDLYFLDVSFDDEGVPMVSTAQCIIGHPTSDFDEASDVDDDEDDEETSDDEGDEVLEGIADVDEEDELLEGSADVDEEDEVLEGIADVDEDDGLSEHFDYFDDGGLGVVFQDFDYADDADGTEIHIIRYFVESCGKLFMVKQEAQYLGYKLDFTRKVEVFEADIVAHAWVPVVGGLGGHALLLSRPISKFILAACGEIEEDAVYFMDTVNVFSMRSQTNSEAQWNYDNLMSLMLCSDLEQPTWIFPPVLVV